MRGWKIIALGAILTVALIATIAHQGSDGFARGGRLADRTTSSPQQIQRISPVANSVAPRKPDADKATETEPWGPVRTTDW